ncbi:APC family permease [Rhodococcus opacus]|uniref:APC family permease n=1 Tax=Rhodococcus opacus TaxID=37919 RepID=UPI001F59D747|nr:APC family permease [Rhodococcus opacus]UNM99110.1 APC family permease [Rhodococcus opacus]
MAPSLVMIIFGVIAVVSAGTAPTAFLVATGAMLLTALSYARLARIYPVSCSAYFYARRNLGSAAGFLVGWAILLDYLFLPMVAWLAQSILLNAQFPAVAIWLWMLINAGLTTAINVIGIALADRLNRLLLAVSTFLVLLFFAYCIKFLAGNPVASYGEPFWNSDSTVAGISAAAAIAAYSFLGFDAVTTLAEETKDAARNIPRAIIWIVSIGGVIFFVVAYVMQLVHPGDIFDDAQAASYAMSVQVGGQFFADWTNLAGIIAGSASCLAVQLSSSRLLFIMGRDGVLPRPIVRKAQRPYPDSRVLRARHGQHVLPRYEHAARNRDGIHQLRGVHGLHRGQPLRHRVLPAELRHTAVECRPLRGHAARRRRRDAVHDHPAQRACTDLRNLLVGNRNRLPRLAHTRLPPADT